MKEAIRSTRERFRLAKYVYQQARKDEHDLAESIIAAWFAYWLKPMFDELHREGMFPSDETIDGE